jgi:PucR family transcriptional regulator, purine catabolism regulatory protein
MPLWLEHLLDDPGLGLVLVAGESGLRERGPVRWVHISEIPDPTPWMEGSELLLTTGLGVKDSPELQRRLIEGLAARGCAGVGFGLGVCLNDVPPAMLDAADVCGLPLFTVPYAVPFIAVTKRVSRHIFDEHYATLRGAVDLHRQVLATVLSGSGVAGVLATVARPMPDFGWLLFDYYGQLLAAHRHGTAAGVSGVAFVDPSPERVWEGIASRLRQRDRIDMTVDDRLVHAAVVRLGDQVEAVLGVVGERELHEHEALLLEQALTGVSLELARGLSVREAHRSRVDELLEEAAAGRLSQQALTAQMQRLGIRPAEGFHVICLSRHDGRNGPGPVQERTLCALAEDVLATNGAPVLGRRDGDVYAIVQAGPGDQADRILRALAARGCPTVAVGRSRTKHEAGALNAAMREAAVAASLPGTGVRDVADLGVDGLLAGIDDASSAQAFVEHVLGAVLDHDRSEGTQLVPTLAAYLRHGCRPGPAAEELCVHRHTLAYRLDRVRDLTGRDPRDGQHLLAFGLALELRGRADPGG